MPAWMKLPEFLARTKYRNPVGTQECAFQLAHNTDQSMLGWIANQDGMVMKYFQWLAEGQKGLATWLDIFPAKDLFRGSKKDTPLFVDVNGGLGHPCIELRAKYPKVHGRVILQDLPHVLRQVIPLKRVEAMDHDLGNEQPVKSTSLSSSIEHRKSSQLI
jgi:demethylsterigmatocystin 6-O-methyltransferase